MTRTGAAAGMAAAGAAAAGGVLDSALFHLAFRAAALGSALVDDGDRFVAVNPAFCALLGRGEAELVLMTSADVTAPADLPAARRATLALAGGRPVPPLECRLVRAGGAEVWVHLHQAAVAGPYGRRYRLLQTVDITEQKRAEAAAAQEARRLQSTIRVQREVTAAVRDRQATLQLVADRAVAAFAMADGAVVELLDGEDLQYAAVAGTLAGSAGVHVHVDHSLSGLAVRHAATMRCDDPQTDPRVDLAACRAVGIGSMIIAPLFAEERTIGVLKVSSRHTRAFDDTDVQQLQLLAGSLSSALRHADDFAANARLLAERGAALARLEAANQLKLDLIGMLGHEIGTPLTTIIGYTEMAREDWDSMSAQRRTRILDTVNRNAHRLDNLVREVLSMVTIDAGELRVRRETVDVCAAVAVAAAAAGTRDVPVDCAPGTTVQVQPGHLQQILVNFLTNATKYAGGATGVRVHATGGRVRIDVHDAGPGVPVAFRDQLFDRFSRADHSRPGTGLGLYIVRLLAEANDGDAGYRPGGPTGSVFTVELAAG